MPRFLIPTRNRPASLRGLFGFLDLFYPGTRLIIADGSDPDDQARNLETAGAFPQLDIEVVAYPPDLPFFERLYDVLQRLDDEMLSLGADDDYPLVDVYDRAQEILEAAPDLVTVVPADILVTLRAPGELSARLSPSRTVDADDVGKRVRDYAYWSFATSYGVTRRSHLLERYKMMAQLNCAGFVDFQIGIDDVISGPVRALGEVGGIRSQTYQHNYFRPTEPLIYLRRADRVLAIRDHVRARLGATGLPEDTADRLANQAISQRIAELAGGPAPIRLGFARSKGFRDPALQEQFRAFYDWFERGTADRQSQLPKLRYVVDVLQRGVASEDGRQAGANYETI